MTKQLDSEPAVGNASLEYMINHLVAVVQKTSSRKQTKAEKQAAAILARCLANRYQNGHPTPFHDDADGLEPTVDLGYLWLSGDLATGRGGSEFVYVCLATSLVEELMTEALKLTTRPIRVSLDGQAIEGKLSRKGANNLAETFTTAATIYLLNNLRDKLNEAMEDLFVEARTVVEELHGATLMGSLNEMVGSDQDATQIDANQIGQSRFTTIIKTIIEEGDQRRRRRLRNAFWEIARRPGRPKGAGGANTAQKFNKSEFFPRLMRTIKELSRTSETEVTRKEVATALGLTNGKALDRLRSRFGDQRGWRECVDQAVVTNKNQ